MNRLNGWQRLRVLLSGVWALCLTGYAAYEYSRFPLEPFTTYASLPEQIRYADTSRFLFIELVQTPWKDGNPEGARIMQKTLAEAKTEQERQLSLNVLNSYDYRSGLSSSFFVVLVSGIIAFWALCYGCVFLFRWIRAGFK